MANRPVISVSKSRVDVGDSVILSGRVAPRSSTVLQRRVGNAPWHRVGTLNSGRTGVIQRSVTPPAGAVGYRVVVHHGDRVRRSAPVLVRVVRPTSVRTYHETKAAMSGSRIAFDTWVEPARGNVPVVLQRRVSSGWTDVATARSDQDGGGQPQHTRAYRAPFPTGRLPRGCTQASAVVALGERTGRTQRRAPHHAGR